MDNDKKGLWFKKTKTGKNMLVIEMQQPGTIFLFPREKTKETQPDFDYTVKPLGLRQEAKSPDPLYRPIQRQVANEPEEELPF